MFLPSDLVAMKPLIRGYCGRDYKHCERLVEKAWNFDRIFPNPALRKIASLGYTKGSLEDSNYSQVVEVNGRIAGFLFGRNERKPHFKFFVWFRMQMLWRLLFFRGKRSERDALLTALNVHVDNRSEIVPRGASEILLFVVDPEFQGQGIGNLLWGRFKQNCIDARVESVYVSTNTSGATGFYESIGFTHVGDFVSPLHRIAQWPGIPCMYQYRC